MAKKKASRQTRADSKQNMDSKAPVVTMDAFSNPAARIGFGTMDLLQATEYPMTRMTQNYQLLTSLYRENWIIQNIISTIPNDMLRKWYDLRTSVAPEYLKQMTQLERRTQIRKKLLLGMCWGRLYGGAVGVILIKGHNDMSLPLNLDTIMPGSFLGLHILDRWNGVYPEGELVTDPEDPDFGLPKFYTVRNDETGTMVARVHHSRVIRFIGRELPWMEQVTEQYWGESEIEAIYEELTRRDNVAGNIAALTFRANINYQETDGLDQLLGSANAEIQRRFWNTLAAQSMMESNFGTRKTGERSSCTLLVVFWQQLWKVGPQYIGQMARPSTCQMMAAYIRHQLIQSQLHHRSRMSRRLRSCSLAKNRRSARHVSRLFIPASV